MKQRPQRIILGVEGESDRSALPILVRRMLNNQVGVNAYLIPQGDMSSASKLGRYIASFLRNQRNATKIIICRDSEGAEISDTKVLLTQAVQEASQQFPGIALLSAVVDHSLEGWFLHDRDAISQYLRLSRRVAYRNPESIERPANLMEQIFRQARRDFIKTRDLPELAKLANYQAIAARSPTFAEFQRALLQM